MYICRLRHTHCICDTMKPQKSVRDSAADAVDLAFQMSLMQDCAFVLLVDPSKWCKELHVAAYAAKYNATVWKDYADIPFDRPLIADLQSVGFELWSDFVAICSQLVRNSKVVILVTDADDSFTDFLQHDLTREGIDLINFSIDGY